MCKKITVYTQAYNSEKYLRQCIDSVVNQTLPVYQYILVNDNSTDKTQEIMEEYASKYDYITVQSYNTNKLGRYTDIIPESATGEYVAIVDSDDWWESDYLQKMVSFMEEQELDLVVTGMFGFQEDTKTDFLARKSEERIILTQNQFAKEYDKYWKYPSTVCGLLFKLELYKKIDFQKILSEITRYGLDTVVTLQYIKQCQKIGIDNTVLYHYRKHKESESFIYYSERFTDNIASYNFLKSFIESNSALTKDKDVFLKAVYVASLKFTIEVLYKSQFNIHEQIDELVKIVSHPLTKETLKSNLPNIGEFKISIADVLKKYINEESNSKYEEKLLCLVNEIFYDFSGLFDFGKLHLFASKSDFWNILILNDKKMLLGMILELEVENNKKYELGDLIAKLVPENSLVSEVKDKEFFEYYADVVRIVLSSQNTKALDKMTEILFSGNELNYPEDFLNLYVKLAALENHIEAFLFGNIQKGYLFLDEKRFHEATQIVKDLVEMGAGESEDVIELAHQLEENNV